jgi:acyl transferase domain-containing protein
MDQGDHRRLLERAARQLRETRTELDAARRAVRAARAPIAVIGAGVRAPGGVGDMAGLWRLLHAGIDAVAPLVDNADGLRPPPAERAPGAPAGQLSAVDTFDAAFFGLSGAEAARMDPQQRLVLETAWEATEDAGVPVEQLSETGVFLGLYGNDYLTMQLADLAGADAYTASGSAHSIAANRLSYLLDLHGPSIAVDTACSSSLVAVHLAIRALRAGDCDLALVGGVNVILSPVSTLLTGKVLPVAPGGRCRTFDVAADGIVRAEGCGMLLLERLDDARRNDRRIRGVLRGSAANHNGRTNGLTAPNPRAQATLLRRALADAGAGPEDVRYVEAHGTGTRLGDPIEVEALREVYRSCAVGSVKTNFGHQEAAAGITGLLKALLVLQHRTVPPHLHLTELNPEIDLGGLRVPVAPEPVEPDGLAAVSSFGFGGANAHVIIEGPPEREERPAESPVGLLLPLSARSGAALTELAERYARRLDEGADAHQICAAAATRRTHHPYRLCVGADTPRGLVQALRDAPAAKLASPQKIAFVFSGQGSQWAGMGREALRYPVLRQEIEACDEIVRELTGWSVLAGLTAEDGRLDRTEVAQVTIGVLQLGLTALLREWGVLPDAVVGHSMGEVIACRVAGALDREQALELLVHRARLTEQAARGGAMVSIALPVRDVAPLVVKGEGRLGIAAVNGPRTTVVSGDRDEVDRAEAEAVALGARTKRLRVEYAFHSPLLDGVAERLAGFAPSPRPTRTALYSTVTGAAATAADLTAGHWVRNLRDRVLFHDAVEAMARDGVTAFVEVGPHPVLLGHLDGTVVGTLRRDRPATTALRESLAELYRAGADIRWPHRGSHVELPLYPWQHERHWLSHEARMPEVPRQGREPLVDDLERYVRERIAKAQGLEGPDAVPGDQPLEGIESIVVVELKNQIEREFGVRVPLQALLESDTPLQLAEAIAESTRT